MAERSQHGRLLVWLLFAPLISMGCTEGAPHSASTTGDGALPNLAGQVQVIGVDCRWAPPASNPAGHNLLWVQPQLRNTGSQEIAAVWADLQFYDERGTLLEEAKREIVYYSPDVGRTLGAGQVYTADPVAAGDPYTLFGSDFMPVSSGDVRVVVQVTAAYERPDVDSQGVPDNSAW